MLVGFLKEYKDVFARSYVDMEGINYRFYQHKINLTKGAKPVNSRGTV